MAAPMKWTNSNRALERLLMFGTYGVGKTKAAFDIIEKVSGHVYYIETDNTLDEFLDARDIGEDALTAFRPRDWESAMAAVETAWKAGSRNDWIVIDNITNMWGMVQGWWIERAYAKDIEQFMEDKRLEILRSAEKNHTPYEGLFHDWTTINSQYDKFRAKILNPPCNLFVTADVKTLSKQDKEDRVLRANYGSLGLKPDGQKRLGGDFRSVFWLRTMDIDPDRYLITTAKDRERERLKDQEWNDFFKIYLARNGWVPERSAEKPASAEKAQ